MPFDSPWSSAISRTCADGHGTCTTCSAAAGATPLRPGTFAPDAKAAVDDLRAYLAKPHAPTDRERVDAALKKLQRGEPLSDAEKRELARIGALSNKGYITLSAGVGVTVTSTAGHYRKVGGELNSDRGAIGVAEGGVERRLGGFGPMPGVKIKGAGNGATDGASTAATGAEVDVGRYGFARAKAGYDMNGNGSSSAYLKGAVEQELPVPGVGTVKPEAYVKVAANRLNETEQLAIDARVAQNTDAFRTLTEQRRAALVDMAVERDRILSSSGGR